MALHRLTGGRRRAATIAMVPESAPSDGSKPFYRPLIRLEPDDASPGARSPGTGYELIQVTGRRGAV